MTELTLEELLSLTRVAERVAEHTQGTPSDMVWLQSAQALSLLAMARELIRIRSALEYLVRVEGPTVIADDGTDYDVSPEQLQEYAASLGWLDPLSPPVTPVAELKGDEG